MTSRIYLEQVAASREQAKEQLEDALEDGIIGEVVKYHKKLTNNTEKLKALHGMRDW